ncbi:MAG: helix-turn-helix transcriptional regulator [Chloroflexota bacterium]
MVTKEPTEGASGGTSGSASTRRPRAGKEAGGAPMTPRLTGDLLTSSLLSFLKRWNAYGYQLVQELGNAGLPGFDSTTVYRTLRQLERAGLVSSFWDTSESGPARRRYSLTKAGETFLDLWYEMFGRYQKVLQSAWNSLDNPSSRPSHEDDAKIAGEDVADHPARRGPNASSER